MTVLYFGSFAMGVTGAWFASKFAEKAGLLDHPNHRSSHREPTPKCGGIGILAAFLFVSIVAGIPPGFWAPATFLALIGFLTDIYDLSPKVRLPVQFLAALIFLRFALFPDYPFVSSFIVYDPSPLIILLCLLFSSLFVVGTANFYNFMDGINGIAGITGVVSFGLLGFYEGIVGGDPLLRTLSISVSMACVGFLPFNMPRARVFMGDVGSILLGFLFGGMVVLLSKSLFDFVLLASFLFTFYADELTTMAVRIKDGENLLRPHRKHVYQLLANELGFPHWKVSVSYGLVQVFVGVSILGVKDKGLFFPLSLLAIYFVGFWVAGCRIRSIAAASGG